MLGDVVDVAVAVVVVVRLAVTVCVMTVRVVMSGMCTVPVVVDAGIGAPSHAAEALEMGVSAVLVNTAIAIAPDPERMARAFRMAVEAGREAFETGLAARGVTASATSPLTAFLHTAA